MTATEAHELIKRACAACPTAASYLDATAIKGMVAIWADLLSDLTFADGYAALKRYLAIPANAGKLPSPGHLRGVVSAAEHGRARTGMDAWGDVIREVGRSGRYMQPRFADAMVAEVVRGMGWQAICDSDNQVADRAHFARAYDALAVRAVEDRAVAGLPGVARVALPEGASPVAAIVGDVAKRLTGGAS